MFNVIVFSPCVIHRIFQYTIQKTTEFPSLGQCGLKFDRLDNLTLGQSDIDLGNSQYWCHVRHVFAPQGAHMISRKHHVIKQTRKYCNLIGWNLKPSKMDGKNVIIRRLTTEIWLVEPNTSKCADNVVTKEKLWAVIGWFRHNYTILDLPIFLCVIGDNYSIQLFFKFKQIFSSFFLILSIFLRCWINRLSFCVLIGNSYMIQLLFFKFKQTFSSLFLFYYIIYIFTISVGLTYLSVLSVIATWFNCCFFKFKQTFSSFFIDINSWYFYKYNFYFSCYILYSKYFYI